MYNIIKDIKIKVMNLTRKNVLVKLRKSVPIKLISPYIISKLIISLIFAYTLRIYIVFYFGVDNIENYILAISVFLLSFTFEDLYTRIFIPKWLHDILSKFMDKLDNKQYMNDINSTVRFMVEKGESSKSQSSDLNKPSSSSEPTNTEKYKMQSSDLSNDEIQKNCPELHEKLNSENNKWNNSFKNMKDTTNKFLDTYRDKLSNTPDNLFKDIKYPDKNRMAEIFKKSDNFPLKKLNKFLDFMAKQKEIGVEAESKKLSIIRDNALPNLKNRLDNRLIQIKYDNAVKLHNDEYKVMMECEKSIKKIYQEAYSKIKNIKEKGNTK